MTETSSRARTRRELREARSHLGCLHKKRSIMRDQLRNAANRLSEPACHSPESLMYDLPSREARCQIVSDSKAAVERVEHLAAELKEQLSNSVDAQTPGV